MVRSHDARDGALIALMCVGTVFVITLLVLIYCRTRFLARSKENEVTNLEGSINFKDSSTKLNPLIMDQDRAQKFRVRARSTTLGRPQFTLSKKSINSIANRESSYWCLDHNGFNSEQTTSYSESVDSALESGDFNPDLEFDVCSP